MASSSIQKSFKYDLFLSFRGEDTRKNFVDHLYDALQRQGIHVFKDDKRLEKGKRIDDELIKAIEDSKLFIIIFSKTYASSSWCLDELVKIMECQKAMEQTAYPVFYDVEPTEVRKQSGVFGEAFAKHEFEESFVKWREALMEAAKLAGWELKNTADGHEAEFIKRIVEEIYLKLHSVNFSVDEKLVGMESRIKDVELLLETGSDDVRMIGIKGMGGGGKTTLARALFDRISLYFEGRSFVENVREASQSSFTGLKLLQKQVLSDVLNNKNIDVNSVYDGKNMMKKMLSRRKVLLVLDDVDHIRQLEALAGEPCWFKAGSRIIITTRDEQVLVAHGVKQIQNVNLLSKNEATCLFSRYAFGRDTPIEGYENLSQKVISYVACLPLTAKVLGSFLHGKNELEWIDALERLETIPEKETIEILELSYMCLENDYKEIFLNVACFMDAWTKDDAIIALECCGFHARAALKVLESKSLITLFQDYSDRECIDVHDLIKEMGRNIVRRFNPDEPSTHSRLWISNEIEDIFANDLGTEATKYIDLFGFELIPEIFLKGFGNMEKLIFLKISVINQSSNIITIDQVRQYFPNSLRYLRWDSYKHWCLPKSFRANNLVGLRMKHSIIKQLWEKGEQKVMKKLKFLDFTCSKLTALDLQMTPNVERLDLVRCYYLEKLDTPSGSLLKLKSLCLSNSKLRTIDFRQASNLELLNVDQEYNELAEIHMPIQCLKLMSLRLSNLKLRALDLRMAQSLKSVDLNACHDLVQLHLPNKCPKLTSLKLSCLSKLRELNIGLTPNLETFYCVECPELVEFYMLVSSVKLRFLHLSLPKLRTLKLGMTPGLKRLCLAQCHDLLELHMPVECPALEYINISVSKLRTLDLGLTPNLMKLSISQCYHLEKFHIRNICSKLSELYLHHSKLRTLDIQLAPNLKILRLKECDELVKLHMPVYGCLKLSELNLKNLKLRTLDLQLATNLRSLHLEECDELEILCMPVDECSMLSELNLRDLKLRTLDIRLAPNLKILHHKECDELVKLHMPVYRCLKLSELNLKDLKLRTLDLRLATNLRSLHLEECDELEILHMPVDECSMLSKLKLRHLKLQTLDLQLAPNLNDLDIQECNQLVELHMPVSGCSNLRYLYLRHLKLRTLDLRLSPHLYVLDIEECPDLVLHMPFGCSMLHTLNLCHCMLTNLDLGMSPNLEKLHIEEFHDHIKGLECIDLSVPKWLKVFHLEKGFNSYVFRLHAESTDICPLDTDPSLPMFRFSFVYVEEKQRSSTTSNLQMLVSLARCSKIFTAFSESICGLQNLRELALFGSIPEMPKHLEQLEFLEVLVFSSIETKHLPDNICTLKHLKSLILGSCSLLEKLPEDIGQLEGLEELLLKECTSLTDIPIGVCKMKRLKELNLAFCTQVEKLPEELGHIKCLEELNVIGTGISRLPKSISLLKGLRVVGSVSLIQSCGLTCRILESDETYCYM